MDSFITLSHGSGGEKQDEMIKELVLPRLVNDKLLPLGDGAYLDIEGKLAFSTDSFVINPLFFKGGDIGKLAVCGTCNDLLMCGSTPKYLSLALIIEEGFEVSKLTKILDSINETASSIGVKIVTGDTKVVERGHGDGIYINTSGIGIRDERLSLSTKNIANGDKVIVTGDIGSHGISIMCERNNFFEGAVESDCALLSPIADIVFKYGDKIKILRDPTRGGVATVLNEFVDGSNFSIELDEGKLPFNKGALGASEILGIDLLYSANEGKCLIIVSADIAEKLLSEIKGVSIGKNAAIIGEIVSYDKEKVLLKGGLGGRRIINKLTSDIFPRIC